MWWIFALIVSSCVTQTDSCPVYKCGNTSKAECARITTIDSIKTYYLQPCNNSLICDIDQKQNSINCTNTYEHPFRYPGEHCIHDIECLSSTCNRHNLVCNGAIKDKFCEDDIDCNPNLFCHPDTKTCLQAVEEGQNCNVAKCHSSLVCNNSKCIKYGSLSINESADTPLACNTLFVLDGKCHPGPKLIRSPTDNPTGPTKCTTECHYMLNNTEYTEPCSCGLSESGEKYCQPGIGDFDLEDIFYYTRRLSMNKAGFDCHIRRGPLCLSKPIREMSIHYYKALVKNENLTRWVRHFNNSDCVRGIFDVDYWYAVGRLQELENKNLDRGGIYVFICVVIVIFCVIVILVCFRYDGGPKKKDEESKEQQPINN